MPQHTGREDVACARTQGDRRAFFVERGGKTMEIGLDGHFTYRKLLRFVVSPVLMMLFTWFTVSRSSMP